jgi:hypothetical protein
MANTAHRKNSKELGRFSTPSEDPVGLLTPNDIKSFRSLYTLQLRYLLSTENNIVKGLNSMIKHASDSQLQQAFQSHLNETQLHVERLKHLKQMIGDLDPEVDDKKDAIIIAHRLSGEHRIRVGCRPTP